MWEEVIVGDIFIEEIAGGENGAWVVGIGDTFFVPFRGDKRVWAVHSFPDYWKILGVVGDTLFLCPPDGNEVLAAYPDGRVIEVAMRAGKRLPRAVSVYYHAALSPERINVPDVGDVYVYTAGMDGVAVGEKMLITWNEYAGRMTVYTGEGERGTIDIMRMKRYSDIYHAKVGKSIVLADGYEDVIFDPLDYTGFCQGEICDIEENTDNLAVFNYKSEEILCWVWNSPRYGRVKAPFEHINRLWLLRGGIWVRGKMRWKDGVFSVPFPNLDIEGVFPYYNAGREEEE